MKPLEKLLTDWGEGLLKAQITDENDRFFGGFRCKACGIVHGRADNAIYPLCYLYQKTGDERYLSSVWGLMRFRTLLTHPDGAVQNDFMSEWKGISAFSAISLLKTLYHFADFLPLQLKNQIEAAAKSCANWVHKTITPGFRANINYYAAAALVNALYFTLYSNSEYKIKAKNLLDYCVGHFTENGLLTGEGQPHDFRTKKGCAPVDIGYNAEESLPCLVETAVLLKEKEVFSVLAKNAKKLLDFMLPDGGWDNTFGVRNNKWTYYGSRTSDGCIGAFALLGRTDPVFYEAALRTLELLQKCTFHQTLYGGLYYAQNQQKPCIHHTFCHACALTDAIFWGIPENIKRQELSCDQISAGYRYYKEIDTYKIYTKRFLATITGYDYATYTYQKGAAHSGGGALSLLYKKNTGALIAGSVYDYQLTEANNMQPPTGDTPHRSLILRAEYEKNGKKYATCLDKNAVIRVSRNKSGVKAEVKARFFGIREPEAENDSLFALFCFVFTDDHVSVQVKKINGTVKLLVPIIENTAKIETQNRFTSEKIFFLTGGFRADEYTFFLDEDVEITIS